VAALPLLLLMASMALQAGADVYATVSAQEAARAGARAASLGKDPAAAARFSLPSPLVLTSVTTFGPQNGVQVSVTPPRLSVLPSFVAVRRAVLP
jgi:hypothetical protein